MYLQDVFAFSLIYSVVVVFCFLFYLLVIVISALFSQIKKEQGVKYGTICWHKTYF